MRILYGVFGYGRGHATRALGVLPDLMQRHAVLVLAGGDAHETLRLAGLPVTRIDTLAYVYGPGGKQCVWRTILGNARQLADLARGGACARRTMALARAFAPDIAISDAEPFTHEAAARLAIPRISFDHFGVLAHCRPAIPRRDRLRHWRDVAAYRLVMGRPDRVIVSSFYPAPARSAAVRVVGPVLRDEVLRQKPVRGDFLLVYLNQGQKQFVPHVERALRRLDMPVVLYGCRRQGADGNLDFRAPDNLHFLADLASCRAVFSTAGNQLVGEAIHLGKPMLVMPEHTVEQRVNALAVEQMGIGMQLDLSQIDADRIRAFLGRELELRGRLRAAARDGRQAASAALESFARELVPRAAAASRRSEAA